MITPTAAVRQLTDHTNAGSQLVNIICAAATAVTVASMSSGITLQSTAGVTEEVGSGTLDKRLKGIPKEDQMRRHQSTQKALGKVRHAC